MNRLSPLIVRRTGPLAPPILYYRDETLAPPPETPILSEDMKLFLAGWLGGLVFFWTFFS